MSDFVPAGPIRGMILDLDGTLVDTLGDFTAALARMLRQLGHAPLSKEAVAPMIGKGSEHLIQRTLERVGAPAGAFPAAWEAYQEAYRALNGQHARVYPGVAEALVQLRQRGLPLACLTNKPTEFARELLRAKGLADFFEVVFGGDAFERKKPDPLPLRMTCEALGIAPGEVLMVGDSSNDAQAARAAGCPVVLVTYGYNHGQPVRAVDADGFFDSLAQLPPRLVARPA